MKTATPSRLRLWPRRPTVSLMNQSAGRRMAGALLPVALLWLAVAWALSAP
jgi:hypothetical protein